VFSDGWDTKEPLAWWPVLYRGSIEKKTMEIFMAVRIEHVSAELLGVSAPRIRS